ncbi:unnamed protein product [Pneumocystis jirovecii]|uniref:Alpha,alpha-trehalose-phosphate synthase (UDP-forming) n=1 Tax=Pneumocystis jirovecii TaxID=42068 RepID=L0PET7_PNEJI|nr:unnamed protein product [Pneumocystis jirovecii]
MNKLYVVSLFLPNTLGFDLDETNSIELNSQKLHRKIAKPIPHLMQKFASYSKGSQDINCDTSLLEVPEDQFFYSLNTTDMLKDKDNIKEVFENERKELNLPKIYSHISSSVVTLREPVKESSSIMADYSHSSILTSRRRRTSFDITLFSEVVWTIESNDQSNCGLGNAIRAAYETGNLEEYIFIGLLGIPTDSLSVVRKYEIEQKFVKNYRSIPIFVSDKDFDNHYNYCCKQVLWPLFHYQVPDISKFKVHQNYFWNHYIALNQAFANKIIEIYKKGDIIWINDYHLLLVPQMVRQKLQHAMIGFFLHISFPSYEVFRCLSVRKQLLEGILGANVIGFQTDEYAYHFHETCTKLLNAETLLQGIKFGSLFINTINLPIGIDPKNLQKKRSLPSVNAWISLLKKKICREIFKLLGMRQKLLAFELFLSKHPEWREKVVLIQVALSTSEENETQLQISNIVTRINSTYGNLSQQHQPLVFLRQDITFSQYLALLTVADILLVTSLREGMNLTSHEFVFCQNKNCGPLIISEFVGSATRFKDAAIIINPWCFEQVSNAIFKALTMPYEERLLRWNKLSNTVMHNDAANWAINFVNGIKTSLSFE